RTRQRRTHIRATRHLSKHGRLLNELADRLRTAKQQAWQRPTVGDDATRTKGLAARRVLPARLGYDGLRRVRVGAMGGHDPVDPGRRRLLRNLYAHTPQSRTATARSPTCWPSSRVLRPRP